MSPRARPRWGEARVKRQAIARGTVWRKARPIVRPGVTPPLPAGWRRIARAIRGRDGDQCRRCGRPAPGGPVDHLVPRRCLVGKEVSNLDNLALLCHHCHVFFKTMGLEPKLFRGDVLAFNQFLAVVGKTGPVPSPHLKARAFRRLRENLYGVAIPG